MLGALIDAGLSLDALRDLLATLPLTGYELQARQVLRHGMRGTKVDVIVTDDGRAPHTGPAAPGNHADHHAAASDGHELRTHAEIHEHHGDGHGHARNLHDILTLIEASSLGPRVKDDAKAVFQRLAEAEARAHGCPVEEVHFHEVGAVDSIVDTVGVVAGLAALGIERVYASPLNTGEGTVKTAHGVLPVPAPATAELLKGVPTYSSGIRSELLTPTAAAVLTTLAAGFGSAPAMRTTAIGYGAGTRELAEQANLVRLLIGEVGGAADASADTVVVIEANIDDMSPQHYELAAERLFAAGALDVWLVPVQMKKFRPGAVLSALAPAGSEQRLADVLLRETTTLGVRVSEWRRVTAGRRIVAVETAYGTVSVKVGMFADGEKAMPEYDDCARLARQHSVPLRDVTAAARAAFEKQGQAR